jgi:hypothetical protein
MKYLFLLIIMIGLVTGCGDGNRGGETNDEHNNAGTEREILDQSVVRDANTDVASLDRNGDGKVFQCPMDPEVISDVNGNCPLCKMRLSETTLYQAQENLNNRTEPEA